jgi:hypothetical protein
VIKKLLYIAVFNTLWLSKAFAQKSEYGGVTASAGVSAMVYQGDLTPKQFGDWQQANLGVQGAMMVPVGRNLGIKGAVVYGTLDGDDKRYDGWRPLRSFSFKSTVTEVSLQLQWELAGQHWEWPDEDRYTSNFQQKKYKRVFPYVNIGIGYLNNAMTRNMDGIDSVYFKGDIAWENYAKEKNTVYKSTMAVMPVGVGVHVLLSHAVRLYAEYSYHMLFNDHLDGFGVAVVSNKPDAYQTFTIGLDFRFRKYSHRDKKQPCYLGL